MKLTNGSPNVNGTPPKGLLFAAYRIGPFDDSIAFHGLAGIQVIDTDRFSMGLICPCCKRELLYVWRDRYVIDRLHASVIDDRSHSSDCVLHGQAAIAFFSVRYLMTAEQAEAVISREIERASMTGGTAQ